MMELLKNVFKKFIRNNHIAGIGNEKMREKWITETLKQIPSGSRILDAGAGEQQYKKFCSHLNYVSQDFAEYNGEGDSKGLQTQKWNYGKLNIISDITSIPQDDASFDAIMCTEVFEHIYNPDKAIKEFSRLLKIGGYLILTAPFCSLTHFAPYHYYSGFNKYFYEKLLADSGFKILTIHPSGNYFEYLGQELLRLNSISEKYAKKKLSLFTMAILFYMLKVLTKLSKLDKGSSELLSYGYHVFAVKK